jgi:hypothetical protein
LPSGRQSDGSTRIVDSNRLSTEDSLLNDLRAD